MNLRAQAPSGGGIENAGGLFRCEEAAVAEHIHEVGKTLASHFRYHFVYDELHIVGLCHAAGYGMCTEECRYYLCRRRFLHAPYHTEHLQFVLQIESVATLYLYATGALAYHFIQPPHGLTEEFVLRGVVQEVGGIEYSTATACNLLITQPVDFIYKLPLTAAGIDYVRVGVAPRRQHHATLCIDDVVDAGGMRHAVSLASEAGEASVLNKKPGIVYDSDFCHLLALQARLR